MGRGGIILATPFLPDHYTSPTLSYCAIWYLLLLTSTHHNRLLTLTARPCPPQILTELSMNYFISSFLFKSHEERGEICTKSLLIYNVVGLFLFQSHLFFFSFIYLFLNCIINQPNRFSRQN